jgi:hypothetical protein
MYIHTTQRKRGKYTHVYNHVVGGHLVVCELVKALGDGGHALVQLTYRL